MKRSRRVGNYGVGVTGMAVLCAALVAIATPAHAQKVEVSAEAGYTGSEGINSSESRPILGLQYNALDITSGSSYGFTFGVFATPNVEFELLWHRQMSTLQASGPAGPLRLADSNVDNIHGAFVYNWGESGAKFRPFFLGGLGVTRYLPGALNPAITPVLSRTTIDSETRFSTTWGGGVKFYPSKSVGLKATMRWTPTYIKSDPGGMWCDPYYGGCWVVGDPDYSNQLEFSGGVTFRFGSH